MTKLKILIRPSDLAGLKFIKDFSLFIKQCYCIAWSVENRESTNVQYVIEKKWNFLKNKNLKDYKAA